MSNNEKLNNFLLLCKNENEFIEIKEYKNSFIIIFEKTIYSNIFNQLRQLENQIMIYHSIDILKNKTTLNLFIYKITNYEID